MKKFPFSSLKSRLYVLVVVSILPVCGLILYTAFDQRRTELIKIEQNVLNLAEAAASEEVQILEGARQLLIVMANYLEAVKFDPAACQLFFSRIRDHFTRYVNLGAAGLDGRVFCSAAPLKDPLAPRYREWFTRALASVNDSAGKFSISRMTGQPVLVMSLPVLDARRQPAAVVFAAIDIHWLNRFISRTAIQAPEGSTISQLDSSGVLLTYQPETLTWVEAPGSGKPFYRAVLDQKRGTLESRDGNGVSLIYAFAPLKSTYENRAATLILSVPSKIAYAASRRTLIFNLCLLAAVFVLAMIIAGVASRYFILKDLDALLKASEMLAGGDLGARITTIHSGGEVGLLGNAFNRMADSLEKQDLERRTAEEELKASREKLRNLSEYIQTVREKERTRIAREIHDNLGQTLTALKMDLSWLEKRLGADQTLLRDKINSMTLLAQDTIQTVQRVSAELRPGILDDFGLVAAIEWQADEFQQRSNISARLSLPAEPIHLARDQSTAVFRIFQEALTNVIRHAGASEIEVRLTQADGRLCLTVRDNGRGISSREISDPRSFGLIGMQERVHPWKGEVAFQGIPNQGTTVIISIPLTEIGKTS